MTGSILLTAAAILAQQTQSFTISLQGPVAETTPLFGPMREAEWAPGWNPRFINPPEPAQREGVVFTTANNQGKERIWLVTEYDANAGRVGYVLITPGIALATIKIRVQPDGDRHSKATITYAFAALAPEGNAEVNQHDAHWAEKQRGHWETAINAVLAKGGGS
jgi:hypothetical protein